MTQMTAAQITLFLNTSSKRGKFKPVVKNFAASGEMYWEITDHTEFPQFELNNDGEKYTVNALRTSFKQNIDKLAADDAATYGHIKCIDDSNGHVYLANEEVVKLTLQRQAAEAAASNEADDDEDETV